MIANLIIAALQQPDPVIVHQAGFWMIFFVVFAIVTSLVSIAAAFLMPASTGGITPDPATLEDFSFPTASNDRAVTEFYGRCHVRPNLLFFGNLTNRDREEDDVDVGYGYYATLLYGIGGRIDKILEFRMDNKVVVYDDDGLSSPFNADTGVRGVVSGTDPLSALEWTDGRQTALPAGWAFTNGGFTFPPNAVAHTGKSLLFLSNEEWYTGSGTYRKKGFIGDDVRSIPNYSLVVQRCPRVLNISITPGTNTGDGTIILFESINDAPAETWTFTRASGVWTVTGSTSGAQADLNEDSIDEYDNDLLTCRIVSGETAFVDGDSFSVVVGANKSAIGTEANPADVAWHWLTRILKTPEDRMDRAAFDAAQATFYTEGLGISIPMNNKKPFETWLKEFERHTDSHVRPGDDGTYRLDLVRKTYSAVSELPPLTRDDVKSPKLMRSSWEGVASDLDIKWTSRADYELTSYPYKNPAGRDLLESKGGQTLSFPYFTLSSSVSQATARIKGRLLRPLARFRCTVTQQAAADAGLTLQDGEVFRWTDTRMGITDMPIRITGVAIRGRNSSVHEIEGFEDWITDDDQVTIPEEEIVLPGTGSDIRYVRFLDAPGFIPKQPNPPINGLIPLAVKPAAGTTDAWNVSMEVARLGSINTRGNMDMGNFPYCSYGTLLAELPASNHTYRGSVTITDDVNWDAFTLTDSEWMNSTRLGVIDQGQDQWELISIKTSAVSGSDRVISYLIRGIGGTPILTHPAGTPVYMFPVMPDDIVPIILIQNGPLIAHHPEWGVRIRTVNGAQYGTPYDFITPSALTGTPTLTLSSGTATFSVGQVDAMVGMRVEYDGSKFGYLRTRTSDTVWTLSTNRYTQVNPADGTALSVESIRQHIAPIRGKRAMTPELATYNTGAGTITWNPIRRKGESHLTDSTTVTAQQDALEAGAFRVVNVTTGASVNVTTPNYSKGSALTVGHEYEIYQTLTQSSGQPSEPLQVTIT